jgi:hypothetical protein
LTSQIKGRKNNGDKYINEMIQQKSITMHSFIKYLKFILSSLPASISNVVAKSYESLAILIPTESEESYSRRGSISSPKLLQSQSKTTVSNANLRIVLIREYDIYSF